MDGGRVGGTGDDQAGQEAGNIAVTGQRMREVLRRGVGGEILVSLRPAPAMAAVVVDQALAHGVHRHLLLRALDRGLHHVALGERVVAETVEHLPANHLGEVGRVHLNRRLVRRRIVRFDDGRLVLRLGDVAMPKHFAQHPVAPRQQAWLVVQRVDQRGQLERGGDRRALRDAELIQRLAVVVLRRGGHAVGAVTQEHLVEVQLQDLVLAQFPLHAQRGEHLDQLARVELLRAEEEVARHLLGDGGAALHLLAASQDHVPAGAHDAAPVDAGVVVEIRVLGRQHGVLEVVRHVRDGDGDAPRLAESGDQLAIGAFHAQRNLHVVVLQYRYRRQPGRHQPIRHADREYRQQKPRERQDQSPAQQTLENVHVSRIARVETRQSIEVVPPITPNRHIFGSPLAGGARCCVLAKRGPRHAPGRR